MKATPLILAAGLIGSAGCNFIGVQGSGVLKTETRTVPSFTRIEVRGCSDVNVKTGPSITLSVSADDNILPLITTEVEKDTLVISSKKSISPKKGIHVSVVMPSLAGVSIQGSGDIVADRVDVSTFDASIAGSGNVHASGSTKTLHASVAGSGDINLANLTSTEADASISGSGDIMLGASERLRASISGSGDITYGGNPQVDSPVAGSGTIRHSSK